MTADDSKTAEIGFAILSLTINHDRSGNARAWKSLDWDLLASMHERGWIADPVGKAKSVVITEKGALVAEQVRERYLDASPDWQEVELLEEGMWDYARRGNEKWFAHHVHMDFIEVGRSGRKYDRSDFFPVTIKPFEATIPLARFIARPLASGYVLTTYDSEARFTSTTEHAHRSSTWMYEAGRWQLLYHQGTPFEKDINRITAGI